MFGNENEVLYFFYDDSQDTYLATISINSWTKISQIKEIQKHLPLPDLDWRIENKEQAIPKKNKPVRA